MFRRLSSVYSENPAIAMRGAKAEVCIGLEIGEDHEHVVLKEGAVVVSGGRAPGEPDVTLSAARSAWDEYLSAAPERGFQTLAGMNETGHLEISGNYLKYYQHLMLMETLFGALRESKVAEVKPVGTPRFEPVTGRYLHLDIEGRPHRLYVEEAGEGIPLLCLHTAGADGRQYRALLNDAEITKDFRIIVFDLPAHGKSSPPAGFENEVYLLTTDKYVSTVMAVKEALGLEQPVVMGCSIGGRAVLHLTLRHGKDFKAAIGLQSALYAETKSQVPADLSALYRPDVHGPEASAASVWSLMAPGSPSNHKWETLWHYMQGGPGIFVGDLFYYFVDGDLRNGLAAGLDMDECPLYMLSGEYDLSATPEMAAELAAEVGATHFEVMKNLGHFPMSENPEHFRTYLLPVLEKIKAQKETV